MALAGSKEDLRWGGFGGKKESVVTKTVVVKEPDVAIKAKVDELEVANENLFTQLNEKSEVINKRDVEIRTLKEELDNLKKSMKTIDDVTEEVKAKEPEVAPEPKVTKTVKPKTTRKKVKSDKKS